MKLFWSANDFYQRKYPTINDMMTNKKKPSSES